MMNATLSIGVIGFGVMGSSMARNLSRSGHRVLGYSRTQAKVAETADAGVISSTPEEIARECSVILTAVSDGSAVEEVLFGSRGVAPLLVTDSLIIDTSTTAPSEAETLHARCKEARLLFVDAPVTGGDTGARNATLTIMCGGDRAAVERAQPILHTIGKKVIYLGPPGAGQRMKAANQIAVGIGIVAMTEALLFARGQGIEISTALEILQGGAAGSWAFSNYAPRIITGDLKPGFAAVHMLKDLKIALSERPDLLHLPGTETTIQLFEELVEKHPGLGNHALVKAYAGGENISS
jgi:3-hydroxyisobutyrate dehydrogenase